MQLTGHGLVGDTSVGVDLLEDSVDVGRVGLLANLGSLLLVRRLAGGLARLLGSLGGLGGCLTTSRSWGLGSSGCGLGCHLVRVDERRKVSTRAVDDEGEAHYSL